MFDVEDVVLLCIFLKRQFKLRKEMCQLHDLLKDNCKEINSFCLQ